jgi:hypothetical protein
MSYNLHHIIFFNSEITEAITIELYKKDETIPEVTNLKCLYAKRQFLNGNGDKFDCIISSELTFGLWLKTSDNVDARDFIVSFHDEWKVILKVDDQIEFVGFLVPNECKRELRDKPHAIDLTATDGLGYLKSIDLTDVNGNKFNNQNSFINYISGSLKKTNLDLNIRVYSNIYAQGMITRNEDSTKDTFSQTYLEYRTFLKNTSTFTDCYNTLEVILKEGYSLFQWFGKWVIFREGEMQENSGPQIWYTEYDSVNNVVGAALETFSPTKIKKQSIIHPINADQSLISKFAVKSVKHTFNYTPWAEIPKNNRFDRGSVLLPLGGPDSTAYTISDWTKNIYFVGDGHIESSINNFYRLSTYNQFGVETDRTIIGETYPVNPSTEIFILLSEAIPVKQGAKVRIGCQKRFDNNFGPAFSFAMGLTFHGVSGQKYTCENFDGGLTAPSPTPRWQVRGDHTSFLLFFARLAITYQDTTQWGTLNGTTEAFPEDGVLYMFLEAVGPIASTGPRQYYKDISFEYIPYIAGGYIPVLGDYWITSQTPDYKDIIEEDVFVSDSNDKLLKGALLYNDGSLIGKTWHRFNVNESREYKELINIARYNGSYRRTWQVSGTFGGTSINPDSNPVFRFPLGFHKHFHFPDVNDLNGYKFQLVPPLTIDYKAGVIDATFVDCLQDGANDGNQLGNTHEFNYIFKNSNG